PPTFAHVMTRFPTYPTSGTDTPSRAELLTRRQGAGVGAPGGGGAECGGAWQGAGQGMAGQPPLGRGWRLDRSSFVVRRTRARTSSPGSHPPGSGLTLHREYV